MTVKEAWSRIILGLVIISVTILGALWITSPGGTDTPRGEIPSLTEEEVQEYAMGRWWQDMSPRDQRQTCISLTVVGKEDFNEIMLDFQLDSDQLWEFLNKRCEL